jgi:hypothetical protein
MDSRSEFTGPVASDSAVTNRGQEIAEPCFAGKDLIGVVLGRFDQRIWGLRVKNRQTRVAQFVRHVHAGKGQFTFLKVGPHLFARVMDLQTFETPMGLTPIRAHQNISLLQVGDNSHLSETASLAQPQFAVEFKMSQLIAECQSNDSHVAQDSSRDRLGCGSKAQSICAIKSSEALSAVATIWSML